MGNCFALCRTYTNLCARPAAGKHRKVVRIVKMDGKVLKFTAPLLVKDFLVNFSGSGVCESKKTSQYLSPSYELRLGNVYYLLPLNMGTVDQTEVSPAAGVSRRANAKESASVKRIKVVITKQQLQELLSKQKSLQAVVSGLEKKVSGDSSTCWRPKLESIPEGIELCLM